MENSRIAFRRNLDAKIVRRITSTDAAERSFHMRKQEVEEIGRESGLPEAEARRLFFLLAGEVWVGEVISGLKHGHPAITFMPEPEGWLGVAFDVPWFQREGKVPIPLP